MCSRPKGLLVVSSIHLISGSIAASLNKVWMIPIYIYINILGYIYIYMYIDSQFIVHAPAV